MSTKKKTEAITTSEPEIMVVSDPEINPNGDFMRGDETEKAAAFGVDIVSVEVIQDPPIPQTPETRTPYAVLRDRAHVIYNELRAAEMKARTMPVGKYRPNIAEMARESADMIDELMRYIRHNT